MIGKSRLESFIIHSDRVNYCRGQKKLNGTTERKGERLSGKTVL